MSVVCSGTPLFTAINTCSPAKHTYNHLICVSKLSLHMRQPQTWGASTTQLSEQGTWTRDVLSQIIKHCDVTDSQALSCHRQSSAVLSQTVKHCAVTVSHVLCCHRNSSAVKDSQALCCHWQSSAVPSQLCAGQHMRTTTAQWLAYTLVFLICLEPVRFHWPGLPGRPSLKWVP